MSQDTFRNHLDHEVLKTPAEQPLIRSNFGQKINFHTSNLQPVTLEDESCEPEMNMSQNYQPHPQNLDQPSKSSITLNDLTSDLFSKKSPNQKYSILEYQTQNGLQSNNNNDQKHKSSMSFQHCKSRDSEIHNNTNSFIKHELNISGSVNIQKNKYLSRGRTFKQQKTMSKSTHPQLNINGNQMNQQGQNTNIMTPKNEQKKSELKNRLIHNLNVQLKVQKFVETLKYRVPVKSARYLKDQSVKIINDLAFSSLSNCYQKQGKFNRIKSEMNQQIHLFGKIFKQREKLEVLGADSVLKWCWDLILSICILFNLFFMPIDLVQDGDPFIIRYSESWKIFMYISLIVFFLDITLQFNIETINERIMDRYVAEKQIYIGFQFLHLIMISLLIAHLFAIMFYGLQNLEKNYWGFQDYWIKANDLDDKDWTHIYMYAVYFSTTTMTTVGYGDMLPSNIEEMGFVIFMMIVASGVFAYVLTCIGEIIMDYNRDNKEYKTEMHLVNRYLNNKNIHQNLKNEVRSYISYKIKLENSLSVEEEEYVVKKLPTRLKSKINMTSNIQILEKCKWFKQFGKQRMEEVAKNFSEFMISENEVIFEENTIEEDPKIYFILQGEVEIFVESNNGQYDTTQLEILKSGRSFGEHSFFTNTKRKAGAKTLTNCTLLTISRGQFLEIIKTYKQDFEVFHIIQNMLIFRAQCHKKSLDLEYINFHCFLCQQSNHDISSCPYIHYIPDREKVVLKYNYSDEQTRKKNDPEKKRIERFSARSKNLMVQDVAHEVMYQIQEEEEKEKLNNPNYNLEIVQEDDIENSYDEVDEEDFYTEDEEEYDDDTFSHNSQSSESITHEPTTNNNLIEKRKYSDSHHDVSHVSNQNLEKSNFAPEKKNKSRRSTLNNQSNEIQPVKNVQNWVNQQQQKHHNNNKTVISKQKPNSKDPNTVLKQFVRNLTVAPKNNSAQLPSKQQTVISPNISNKQSPRLPTKKLRHSVQHNNLLENKRFEEMLKKTGNINNIVQLSSNDKKNLENSLWLQGLNEQQVNQSTQQQQQQPKKRKTLTNQQQQQVIQIQHQQLSTQVSQNHNQFQQQSYNPQKLYGIPSLPVSDLTFQSTQQNLPPQLTNNSSRGEILHPNLLFSAAHPINTFGNPSLNNIMSQGGRANMKKDLLLNLLQNTNTDINEILKLNPDGSFHIEEKPYYAIKFFPEHNYNPKKMSQNYNKYQPFHKAFGIFTFQNRFKAKMVKSKQNQAFSSYMFSQRLRNQTTQSNIFGHKRQRSVGLGKSNTMKMKESYLDISKTDKKLHRLNQHP